MDIGLLNRIILYAVAASAFAYLIYDLVGQGEKFTYLHFLVFLLIVFLVLVPFAKRLRVPKLIDFESKLEALRDETKRELANIRNQISTTIEAHIKPVQQQLTVIGMDSPAVKQLAEVVAREFQRTTAVETGKDDKYTRTKFLRKADSYRARAYDVFFMAYHMQIAIREQRQYSTELDAFPIPSDKIDERIIHMINYLLNGGVALFAPPVEVERIAGNMEAIKALLEIRRKVDDTESGLPSQQDMEELFTKVGDVLSSIIAGVVLVGWQSILSQIRISQLVEGLKAEYDIKDTNNED